MSANTKEQTQIRTPKPENLAKLTEEQRKVYDAWTEEQQKSNIIIEQALEALGRADSAAAQEHFKKLDDLIPSICEHGKSIWVECQACEDIQRTLYPEDYDTNGNALPIDIIYNRTLN